VSEVAALVALAATLAAAVARPRLAPDWAVAAVAAGLLVATGVLSAGDARSAVSDLGPTIAFLAALLVLADGCREAGLFEALGAAMAQGSRGSPRRLLAESCGRTGPGSRCYGPGLPRSTGRDASCTASCPSRSGCRG